MHRINEGEHLVFAEKEFLKEEMNRTTENLEQKIHEAGILLRDNYERVKDSVEQIKTTAQALSPKLQFHKRPWVFVGGAVGGGFVLTRLALRKSFGQSRSDVDEVPLNPVPKHLLPRTSLIRTIVREFEPELKYMRVALVGFVIRSVADALRSEKPVHQDPI